MKKTKSMQHTAKKTFLNLLFAFILILGFAAILAGDIYYNETHYNLEFYKTGNSKIENRIRIVFLSDIHLHEYGKENSELLANVKALAPDLIALGGDLVIDSNSNYENMLSLCRELVKLAPVYGVLGNHEEIRIYHHDDKGLVQAFEATGVKLLRNAFETVTIKNTALCLVGVEGSTENFEKYGAKKFMDYYRQNRPDAYTVCISHVPTLFTQQLSEYPFDLGLAGHAHGGIVRLPYIGGLFTREEGWFPKYTSGSYTLQNGAELIVSRGLGNSKKIPRINNTPELSVIDLS